MGMWGLESRAMQVSLVLVRSDGKSQEVALKKPTQTIGRQTDCALRVPSSSVSRHHCEIAISEAKVSVRDLGSSNGTFVNRKRITQVDLAAGDLISVGEFVFVTKIDGKPASIDAEEAYDDGIVMPSSVPASGELSKPAAPVSKAAPAKPAGPAKHSAPAKTQDDDDDDLLGKGGNNDDSSVMDFDFLDEDEDLKKQPKL
jgi:pSer/pThr/pTyr-binding forkhead associated (FHA) protein